MNLVILDRNFDSISIFDTYESLIWTDRYQEAGDFEICTPMNISFLNDIKKDYYLWSTHSDHVMIIENISIKTDVEQGIILTVTGESLESILKRRVIWGSVTLSGNFQDEIERLFNDNIISPEIEERKISNFVFKKSEDPRIQKLTIESQYNGDNIYDVIVALCKERDLGFKMVLTNDKKLEFEFYYGLDRSYNQFENTYVVFSPKFNNLVDSNYMESKSSLKNVTLIGGEGEGSLRKYTTIGEEKGLDRREIFTDAKDISSSINVSMTESFDFDQFPGEVFDDESKTFRVYPGGESLEETMYFNSCMINVSGYAGQTIEISLPKYTNESGNISNFATILVDSGKNYISTLKVWEKNDDEEAKTGSIDTYEIVLPKDAKYLYTSMFSQRAIDDEVYRGELNDFACKAIKMSDDEYLRLLKQKGKEKLSENIEIVSFEGETDPYGNFVYGEDYTLGDVVQVTDEYNHQVTSRIVELILSEDPNGNKLYPTFSTIVPEEIEPIVPEGYTKLKYIQSDGRQYINTFFVPDNYSRVVMDVEPLSGKQSVYFGVRDNDEENAFIFRHMEDRSVIYEYGKNTATRIVESLTERINIDVNMNECSYGTITFSAQESEFKCSYNLILFGYSKLGVVEEERLTGRLYSCRIYNDGTLVRNFIPCIDPENRIGLYDIIDETFYPNLGEGEFVAGKEGAENKWL